MEAATDTVQEEVMPSIEEAWAKLINRPLMGRLATEDAAYGTRKIPAIKGAARALALAVLESCEFEYSTAKSCELLTAVEVRWPALRARIEALGS